MKIYKKILMCLLMGTMALILNAEENWIFSYNSDGENGGLCLAISSDKKTWKHTSYPNRNFFNSNLGPWGNKKMKDLFVFKDDSNTWHCVWSISWEVFRFGHNTSLTKENLVDWRRQDSPETGLTTMLSKPIVYKKSKGVASLEFAGADGKFYQTTTKDFKKYSPFKEISKSSYEANYAKYTHKVTIDGKEYVGQINEIDDAILETFKKNGAWDKLAPWHLGAERATDDAKRFEGLTSFDLEISADASQKKKISDMLMGIFFEDINYAADGGLYAELIQNRDFEYSRADLWDWQAMTAWNFTGSPQDCKVETENPIHKNNVHYISLNIKDTNVALQNMGYGDLKDGKIQSGIVLKKNDTYNFSAFVKGDIEKTEIRLTDANGKIIARDEIKTNSKDWKKETLKLVAKTDVTNAKLEIIPLSKGNLSVDMVSLFPQKTFKERKNGLRADLAKAIANLKPKFVRFPGGCLVHARNLDQMYRWEKTVGELEERQHMPNIWRYHQTLGLGYHEYFQFCEDLGAEAVPVVSAGVTCPNPQLAIPMEEMPAYVQSVLDLIEYANGDAKSTKWGNLRAKTGHPKPFNLKYLGIGNEDDITDMFEIRYKMISDAVKARYPEIKVIGTSGPFCSGRDYEEGWLLAKKLGIKYIDEHYYVSPGWFIHNQNFYDNYDRKSAKVYLGEYAAHIDTRKNTMETALACAIHLTNLERNGDIVEMASYAPLLSKKGFTQWTPDLIYFDNSNVYLTTDYYVQQLFGANSGNVYIPTKMNLSEDRKGLKERVACSVVEDSKTGDTIVKLVNLTPLEVNLKMSIPNITKTKNVIKTVLTGNFDAEDPVPQGSKVKLSGKFTEKLTPYSLTILRFKK